MLFRYVKPFLGLGVFLALVLTFFVTSTTHALDYTMAAGAMAARGSGQVSDLFGSTGIFTTITNVMLFIIGALSVVMIIVGGLRYTISGGNASAITAAKNTILYAIVGLVIAILAFAIINFVITTFEPGSTNAISSAGTDT